MSLTFATLYQRFIQRIYLMLSYATLYQRFKQRIYIMLNIALTQVTGYLKLLALRVYIVNSPQIILNNCQRGEIFNPSVLQSMHDIMNSTALSRPFSIVGQR